MGAEDSSPKGLEIDPSHRSPIILGIYVRYGYWFSLDSYSWQVKAPPPLTYLSSRTQPNGMVSWRGRPTYFGFPDCDGEGQCTNSRVIQVRNVCNHLVR